MLKQIFSVKRLVPNGMRDFWRSAHYALALCWETHPRLMLGIILAPTILSLLPAALALTARNLINSIVDLSTTTNVDTGDLQLWIWLSFFITLLTGIGQLLDTFLTQSFREKLGLDLTSRIMSHAATLDFAHFEDPHFQDNFGRVKDKPADHLLLFVTMGLKILTNGLQLVTLLAILAAVEPLLLWLILPLSLPYLFFQLWLSKKRFLVEESQLKKQRRVGYYFQKLTNSTELAEVRILDLAPLFLDRVQCFLEEFRHNNIRILQWGLFGSGLFVTLLVTGTYFILYRVSMNVIDGHLSVGDIAVYVSATAMLRMTLNSIMNALGVVRWKILHVSALRQFMMIQPSAQLSIRPVQSASQQPVGQSDGLCFASTQGGIEIANLRFTYQGTTRPVLDGISLHIKAGETVALVGENGAGKTTLVKLLARFYEPDSGEITFDGVALNQIPPETLHRQIAYVFQNFGQYEATVADNLAFGNWTELLGKPQKVAQLAELVGIQPLIDQMPQGYDTQLGRQFGDYTLSGGQWQQIAIARAFARDASLLILDEPTSNLDAQSEYRLFSQFKELSKGRTTILISHRFSTVRMADRILVMDKGRIVENGIHEALMAQKGQYAALYELHHRQIDNKFDHDVEVSHAQ